jgi:NodT family efflux transporter outer membrane factor (OMF) lipoprotein
MSIMLRLRNLVAATIINLALIGCVVGPNYRSPEAPGTTAYTSTALPEQTAASPGPGGTAQRLAPGQELPAEWWTLFYSTTLDQLVRQALTDNPTLAAAQATLRQSQENVNVLVGSALYPSVNANLSATREKISGAQFGQPNASFSPFTLYNASVSVSYALDLFGGARRELESLQSQVDFQRFQLEGAYLTITSNVVTTAVKEAALRAQIRAMQEIVAAQEKQLSLVERQFKLGGATRTDVLAQRSQLAQTRASLPALNKSLAQTRHQLAILIGRLPNEAGAIPEFELDGLQLPAELPVSLPSSLTRQRPDIRASEALLHSASAQIGVATANQYPQLTLTGSYGSMSTASNNLFSSKTNVWSLGAGLFEPVFRGGSLSAQRRAAVAAYDQAMAQYRTTVLQAFQNVADVLGALEEDANTLKAQTDSEEAARETLDLTQKQFKLGGVSYLSLLNAERQYQEARIGLVQAQAARFADTAALFQALGGGWWNRAPQAEPAAKTK